MRSDFDDARSKALIAQANRSDQTAQRVFQEAITPELVIAMTARLHLTEKRLEQINGNIGEILYHLRSDL